MGIEGVGWALWEMSFNSSLTIIISLLTLYFLGDAILGVSTLHPS